LSWNPGCQIRDLIAYPNNGSELDSPWRIRFHAPIQETEHEVAQIAAAGGEAVALASDVRQEGYADEA